MARLSNKGQLAGYEALLIIILLGVSGYVTYLWAHKPSDSIIYSSGSNPKVSEFTPHCSPFSCCNDKVEEFMDAKNNPIVVNSVKH